MFVKRIPKRKFQIKKIKLKDGILLTAYRFKLTYKEFY